MHPFFKYDCDYKVNVKKNGTVFFSEINVALGVPKKKFLCSQLSTLATNLT